MGLERIKALFCLPLWMEANGGKPKHYCPPGRHFGKHTKPVAKKGKR